MDQRTYYMPVPKQSQPHQSVQIQQTLPNSPQYSSGIETAIKCLKEQLEQANNEKEELKKRIDHLERNEKLTFQYLMKQLPLLLSDILERLIAELEKSPELLEELKKALEEHDRLNLTDIAKKLEKRIELEGKLEELEELDVEYGWTLLFPVKDDLKNVKSRAEIKEILKDFHTLENILGFNLDTYAKPLDFHTFLKEKDQESDKSNSESNTHVQQAVSILTTTGKFTLETIWMICKALLRAAPAAGGLVALHAPRQTLKFIKLLLPD